MKKRKLSAPVFGLIICCMPVCECNAAGPGNPVSSYKFSDRAGTISLTIDCNHRCAVTHLKAAGRDILSDHYGIYSSVQSDDKRFTTLSGIKSPDVETAEGRLTISGIGFGDGKNVITEKWIFSQGADYIDWTIVRSYTGNMTLDDTGFPEWSFNNMETWTGALLGNGGVAWCRFFDRKNASLGNHTGNVLFWNRDDRTCLRIEPHTPEGHHLSVRFSRQEDDRFTLNYTVSEEELRTKNFLARFIIDRQDIWDAFDARGTVAVTYRISSPNYGKILGRGEMKGLGTAQVEAVLNTIARVGVIDDKLMGSNNWHLDMGFVCLHEHWVAQMGIAIADACYTENYRKTLDYFRDNALGPDGNVKDRWAYRIWDSQPGTFENGFYECQWGDLLDSNTDYVINVAELFQLNGDSGWLAGHKVSCEKALEYLLRRDSDRDGLIEAYSTSHAEKKGSDWIDVIWASWENALVNAKLYTALTLWADAEEIIGDLLQAARYRDLAAKCRESFNKPVGEGGFWNPEKQWYVYWRDKDNSIHGDNLVTPVNFMAISSGICSDPVRKKAILDTVEGLMEKENLFMWPLCFFPFPEGEGAGVNYPFPSYENGDIFLAWGEAGIRAYQDHDPSIPVKYIKNVLTQYEKDGLAFQRYSRTGQTGQGSDILANNCMPVVGLYRDIYGIQPQHDRLYLDPHMTEELDGTTLNYRLRDKDYLIRLSRNDYSVTADSFTVRSGSSFALSTTGNNLTWYDGSDRVPSLLVTKGGNSPMSVEITGGVEGRSRKLEWTASTREGSLRTDYTVYTREAGISYRILRDGKLFKTLKSDSAGHINFTDNISGEIPVMLSIVPEP